MKNLSIKKELDKINLFVYLTVPKETGINMQDVQSLSDGLVSAGSYHVLCL